MSTRPGHHAPTATRRCRPRAFAPDAPRPSELLTAFFRAGLLFMIAALEDALIGQSVDEALEFPPFLRASRHRKRA